MVFNVQPSFAFDNEGNFELFSNNKVSIIIQSNDSLDINILSDTVFIRMIAESIGDTLMNIESQLYTKYLHLTGIYTRTPDKPHIQSIHYEIFESFKSYISSQSPLNHFHKTADDFAEIVWAVINNKFTTVQNNLLQKAAAIGTIDETQIAQFEVLKTFQRDQLIEIFNELIVLPEISDSEGRKEYFHFVQCVKRDYGNEPNRLSIPSLAGVITQFITHPRVLEAERA